MKTKSLKELAFESEYEKAKRRNKAKLVVKALLFYAQEENYSVVSVLKEHVPSLVLMDRGALAREAMEWLEDD